MWAKFLCKVYRATIASTIIAALIASSLLVFAEAAYALDAPILLFSSAKSGPNTGWPGQSGKGAVITVWGRNLGAFGAASSLTVCGVALDSEDGFFEWGATTSPQTPKGISRITFHLTSAMSGSGGIQATVDGVASNSLPFSVSDIGSIFFYPDHSADNGWSDVDDALESMEPGDFLYFKNGSYSFSEYIGYRQTERNGTDSNRITMTSYPGENPTFGPGYLRVHSQYWTFANLHLDRFVFQIGGQRDFCTDGIPRHGLRVVGNEFTGQYNLVIQAFGHDFDIVGNYVETRPVDDTSYPFYLCSGSNRNVSYNEIHGGSRWSIHAYDEDRPNCEDRGRTLSDWVFEGNILDATDVGQGFRGALIIQANNVANIENMTVKNNVLYADGSTPTEAMIRIRHNVDGINLYNNTIYGGQVGVVVTDTGPDNIVIKNNIFHNVAGYDIQHDGNDGTLELDTNLYESDPVLKDISDNNPIVGNVDFIDADRQDFRVGADSEAVDNGLEILEVSVDLEGLARPQHSAYDIGAHEYTDGIADPDDNNGDSGDSSNGGGCLIGTLTVMGF